MYIRAFLLMAITAVLLLSVSCGGGGGSGTSNQSSINNTEYPPLITAYLMSFQPGSIQGNIPNLTVFVQDLSTNTDITTAIVTINDKTITYNSDSEAYEGNVLIAPGENVVLTINVQNKSYTLSTKQFTAFPTISAPFDSTWYTSLNYGINWTVGSPVTDAVYNLAILDANDPYNGQIIWPNNADETFQVISNNGTSYSFLVNSFTPGDRLLLIGIVRGETIPGAASSSQLLLSGCSTIPVKINDASLQSISVTPTNPTMPWGTTQQFSAIGTFSDNSTADITTKVHWMDNSFSTSTDDYGRVYASSTGSSKVTAYLNQINGSASVNVLPARLLSIQISPNDRSIVQGTKQHFSASGSYEDGSLRDITSMVLWNSSNISVAEIGNITDSNGVATPVSNGTTTISASLSSISASTGLTVANRPALPGNYVYLQSDTGDFIGDGGTYSYPNAQLNLSVTGGHLALNMKYGFSIQVFSGDFIVPNTMSQLQTGFYDNVTRYPFHNPATGGLSWTMGTSGCNMLNGWFAIDSVTYNNGALSGIDLRFEQKCENNPSALYGWIHVGP